MKKIIQSRLAKLPPKIAMPLTHLAKIGQMKEQDIKTVLDAGDLTGNHNMLVGFAAGAMGMKAQQVPVTDTVAMAKRLGRTIRLDWTPRRWHEEHDKMAKAVTLLQFRKKNVNYDVEFYANALPRKFPGYIIRNSLRLATVGWYQRHCVASYHSKCVSGSSAFVCVFVDHTRWTVELKPTANPEVPVRITQIRTTDNRGPDEKTEQKIYEYLGLPAVAREIPAYIQRNRDQSVLGAVTKVNLSRVHEALAKAGVEFVHMNYDPNPGRAPLLALPELATAPTSMDHVLEVQLDLIKPSGDRDPESGQLLIEQQTETLGNAIREMQQRLTDERRENQYRWRRPPKREHYTAVLDVARRVLEITHSTSNGHTLNAQVETSTMNVLIEECPDVDELLQAV